MVTGQGVSLPPDCGPLAELNEEGARLGWAFAQWRAADRGRLHLTWRRADDGAEWSVSVSERQDAEKSFQQSTHAQVSYRGAWATHDADGAWKQHTLARILEWAEAALATGRDEPIGVLLGLVQPAMQPSQALPEPGKAADSSPPSFCSLPFTSLDIDQHGQLRPCCLFGEVLHDDQGLPFSVGDATPEAVWNSAHLQQIRDAMRDGKRLAACQRCWEVEAHQGESKRRVANASETSRSFEETVATPTLRSLTLYPSTRCNLRCRICCGDSSSAIAHEYARLVRETPDLAALLGQSGDVPESEDWLRNTPVFFAHTSGPLQTVEHVEWLGGEPLLSDEHFDFLALYVKQGTAERMQLSYSTNGTVLPRRARELWPHFLGVSLKVSLDGMGPYFEYLRYPARWSQVLENIAQFTRVGPRVRVDVNATPSALSILQLPELVAWAETQRLHLGINALSGAQFLDPRVLPVSVKVEVRRRFEAMAPPADRTLRRSLSAMLAQMDAEDWSAALPMFVQHTQTLDRARQQRFAETFPDLARLIAAAADSGG